MGIIKIFYVNEDRRVAIFGCADTVYHSNLMIYQIKFIILLYNNNMGNSQTYQLQSNIQILHIPLHELQSDYPIEAGHYAYPKRCYSPKCQITQHQKQSGHKQIQVDIICDQGQTMMVRQQFIPYLTQSLNNFGKNLELQTVLFDEVNVDKYLIIGSTKEQNVVLILKPFDNYNTQNYLNICYQLNTYSKIKQIECKNLMKIQGNFSIQPGRDIVKDYTQVIILEQIQNNLSTIIDHRRRNKILWTVKQFYQLVNDLVNAVSALHSAGLCHNDIRPSNVYYSPQKQCYVLGSYSNVTSHSGNKAAKEIIENNHYRDSYAYQRPSLLKKHGIDLSKSDVYSLGMTLLSAFYLCEPIDRKKSAPFSRSLAEQYPVLTIIRSMTYDFERRSNILEIQSRINSFYEENSISLGNETAPQNHIQYSNKNIDMLKRQKLIANGYKRLGNIAKWKKKLSSRPLSKLLTEQSLNSAKYYKQLALISKYEGNEHRTNTYYMKCANIFENIGQTNLKERFYSQAISYFKSGLMILSDLTYKQQNLVYLNLHLGYYQALIIGGFEQIPTDQLAKLQAIFKKIKTKQPCNYYDLLNKLITIYEYYEQPSKCLQLLLEKKELMAYIQLESEDLLMEKHIAECYLRIVEKEELSEQERQSCLNKCESELNKIYHFKEHELIQNTSFKLEMMILQINLYLFKRQYESALNYCQDVFTFIDRECKIDHPYSPLYPKTHKLMGQIYSKLGMDEQARMQFNTALGHYKKYHGSLYNIDCALVIEEMANLFRKKNQIMNYLQCLQLSTNILRAKKGKYHKDLMRVSILMKDKKRLSDSYRSTQPYEDPNDSLLVD